MNQAVKRYCQQKQIRIITKPSGAVRFLGDGVDLLVASARNVSIEELQPYEPRKGRALRNIWRDVERTPQARLVRAFVRLEGGRHSISAAAQM